MKSFILLLVSAMLTLVGCSSSQPSPSPSPSPTPSPIAFLCPVEQAVDYGIAAAIAAVGGCQNVTQIQQDLQTGAFAAINICPVAAALKKSAQIQGLKATPAGPIASVICPLVVQGALQVIGNSFKPSWQCSLPNSVTASGLTVACNAIPF